MIDSTKPHTARSQRQRHSSTLTRCVVVIALALAASFAAVAFAASTTVTIGSASNSTLGEQVLVNSQGRTLYALSPETTSHLLCKSSECLKFWPPLTVSSRKTKLKDGPGAHGHLGILRRSDGMLQITLRGLPLYRYSGDRAKNEANGQGIKSFGGTWHAVTAAATSGKAPTAAEPTSTTPSNGNSSGGYESPGYGTTSSTPTSTTPSTTSTTQTTTTTPTKSEEGW
jgi:predicted lipoprotein with Yx(FWY)xxD motif